VQLGVLHPSFPPDFGFRISNFEFAGHPPMGNFEF
jgi:hypothetical protein